ncbi:MAG: glycosyltransferase [Rhodospirillaceae bacterium]|nr:MAG: glycosyltransferase [Rhodospirillaceae bacterium]
MKILLTVHQFFPDHRSGTEVLTLAVAKELQRRGHDVRVLTGFPNRPPVPDAERLDGYDVEGVRVFRFSHGHRPVGDQTTITEIEYGNRLAAGYFARLVAMFAPDIVHFFHFNRLGAALVDVAVKSGTAAYYTPTDFWSVCQTAQLMLPDGGACSGPSKHSGNCVKHVAALTQGRAVGQLIRYVPDAVADLAVKLTADGALPSYPLSHEIAALHRRKDFLVTRLNWLHGIVSPTAVMTDILVRNGVDRDLIVQSGYGIETPGGEAAVATLGEAEPLNVGYIGTLAPHKGCHVLIDAFRRIAPGKARLKIYGNPADFPHYYADLLRRAAGSPAITFCGTFPNHEIGEILSGLHVLVVPSLWYENAPLVMHAALAAKRPVIASHLPGLSETVKDCWNGLLFPAGSVNALHDRLARLLGNRSLLTTLSRNCYKPKTTAAYVDELLALYAKGPLRDMRKRDYHGLQDIQPVDAGWVPLPDVR